MSAAYDPDKLAELAARDLQNNQIAEAESKCLRALSTDRQHRAALNVLGMVLHAQGRHEDAVFRFVASLGGSISAEHGIGALKAPWLPLARTDAERALFARIRSALDPAGTLNPNVLPR